MQLQQLHRSNVSYFVISVFMVCYHTIPLYTLYHTTIIKIHLIDGTRVSTDTLMQLKSVAPHSYIASEVANYSASLAINKVYQPLVIIYHYWLMSIVLMVNMIGCE
jgi:hypothetical protein